MKLGMEKPKIVKTADEWKRELTPEQYWVTRQKGTEPPFTGKYANEHADGVYHCVSCGAVLFDSSAKFEIRQRMAELYPARGRRRGADGNR